MNDDQPVLRNHVLKLLLLPIVGYVFIFLIIVVDEIILKTFWISSHIDHTEPFGEVFQTLYCPLIYLVNMLL